MTAKTYTITKAWTMDDNGMDKQAGWDLFCNGEWCQRFWLKRDAVTAKNEAENEA